MPKPDQVEGQTDDKGQQAAQKQSDSKDVGKTPSDKPAGDVKMIKIGEEEVPFTEEKFKEGYMRNTDYTQKSQTLADDRKQVDSQLEYLQQKEAELADREKALTTKPAITEGDLDDATLEKELELQPLDDIATDAEKANRKAILKQERRWRKNQAEETKATQERDEAATSRANEEIQAEIEQVKEKYGEVLDMNLKDPDSDISAILDLAYVRGAPNLLKVAEAYIKRLDKGKDGHIKAYLKKKEEDAKKDMEKGTGAAPAFKPVETSLKDGSALKTFRESIKTMRAAVKGD